MGDFLLEIGTEEIPDWMIEPALEDLRARFQSAFGAFGGSSLAMDGTPRRLVLNAKDLLEQAPDVESVVQGPYLSAGEKAAEGFARKQGAKVAELAKLSDGKGERYVFHQLTKGQSAVEALSAKLPEIIASIHFPKAMYWTKKSDLRFIRPIRWIVALLGDEVVPFEIASVKSGDKTRGHRILGAKEPVRVTVATYREVLRENFVIVSAQERQQRIEAGLSPQVHHDPELLKTLVYLTEFPTTIHGSFDPSYLELPKEILSTVMRHHQRYFSVLNPDGSLAPQFVAVTNTNGDPDGLIRQGNERVLRARFNDARFFWQVDQQKKLRDRVEDLANVTFQAKIGSYRDKAERIRWTARDLANRVGANLDIVGDAAELCKCDLTTEMVKEFPELQGIVGGLYAHAQGEGEAVATVIYDQYKPVSMEDSIPRTLEGRIVSIADKLDTLTECFQIGLVPTGSRDPFALRRAAQGIVKILFESRLPINIIAITSGHKDLREFIEERIATYLRDNQGFAYDEVNAIMAMATTAPADLEERTRALSEVRKTPDFEPLAASFKRMKNIVKADLREVPFGEYAIDEELLSPGAEQDLYRAFLKVRNLTVESSSYGEKLSTIATLRPNVDLFFDKILVNDPDPVIRQNRLALLFKILTEFSAIADFSQIVTQGVSGV